MPPIVGIILNAGLKWLMDYFMPSKDEKLGKLEVISKDQSDELTDIQKAQVARNGDNSGLDDELRKP